MRICINCEEEVQDHLINDQYRTCLKCLKKERFVMQLEYDNDKVGYNVLTGSNLRDLCKRYKLAEFTGFDTYIGAITYLRIKSVEDVITGKLIEFQTINDILEEL